MKIKMNPKIRRKTIVRRKSIIRLRTTNARITQNLGNGFRRFVFTRVEIAPGGMMEISMLSGADRRVISGGWSIRLVIQKPNPCSQQSLILELLPIGS